MDKCDMIPSSVTYMPPQVGRLPGHPVLLWLHSTGQALWPTCPNSPSVCDKGARFLAKRLEPSGVTLCSAHTRASTADCRAGPMRTWQYPGASAPRTSQGPATAWGLCVCETWRGEQAQLQKWLAWNRSHRSVVLKLQRLLERCPNPKTVLAQMPATSGLPDLGPMRSQGHCGLPPRSQGTREGTSHAGGGQLSRHQPPTRVLEHLHWPHGAPVGWAPRGVVAQACCCRPAPTMAQGGGAHCWPCCWGELMMVTVTVVTVVVTTMM